MIIKSLIDFSEETYKDNYNRLIANSELFSNSGNKYYLALFYNHLGLAQKNLGMNGVSENLHKAKKLFKFIGNRPLESATQNNISRFLQSKGEFEEALISSDEAILIAQNCNDLRQQGIILDTIAQIHLDLGNYNESLKHSNRALDVFERTEAYSYLIEASETKIRAFHKLSKYEEALTTYAEALMIARTQTAPKLASNLTEKTADLFKTKPKLFVESEKTPGFPCIDFELPDSVRGSDFIAVELKTSRLQDYGMLVGDLVIVKEIDTFEDKDLVLVEDFDGEIFIGKAHRTFDCLELHFGDANSTFFEDEYIMLGKAVLHLTWSKENKYKINVI